MENTEKVLFEDDSPQWYLALGERWVGPLSASDVYERVISRKISWAHFVWRAGEKEWKRICDVPVFAGAVPQTPSKNLQNEVKESSKEISFKASAKQATAPVVKTAQPQDERGWYLYYNETQFGPFTKEDVIRFLQVGKITPRVHAWRSGLGTWTRIEGLDSFKDAMAKVRPSEAAQVENRKSPRRPMLAKILFANDREVNDAVCRDISVGGMQVLTDQLQGKVGDRIKLNVSSPSGTSSADAINPFVAEGVIVRFLEDQKGFSFRFERISDQARHAIEKYISSAS